MQMQKTNSTLIRC